MNNKFVIASLLLLIVSAVHASPAQPSAERLSQTPLVSVDDNGECQVTGAMWANGPVANSKLRLVSADRARSVDVRTDENGVYHADIPNARGLVFNEVNDTRVYQTGSRIPAEWTNASIRCKQATVVIGPFIRVN
jgi:hypothetical protein